MNHAECCEAVALSQIRTALAVLEQIRCADLPTQGYVHGAKTSVQRAIELLEINVRNRAAAKRDGV